MAESTPDSFRRPCHPRPIEEHLPHINNRFDDDGDLTLVVGGGERQKQFIVDSRAMARASPVFKSMLFGPFKEARPRNGSAWSVEVPEDDAEGLEILLSIIHARFTVMQPHECLSDHVTCNVCILADKYFMMNLLTLFIGKWIPYTKNFDGNWHRTVGDGAQHRLAIAKYLGNGRAFWKVIGYYAFYTYIIQGQLAQTVSRTMDFACDYNIRFDSF